MPLDPDQLAPADPSPWARTRVLPRIIVHPKGYEPPPAAASDGPDDWFVPSEDGYPDDWFVPSDDGYPDDWFVPAHSATPGAGQPAPAAQPNVTGPTPASPSAVRPDPFAAYWSRIPADRVGAMAWHPPIFSSSDPFAPSYSPANSAPSALPSGGLFDGLAQLANSPAALPTGGLLGALAQLAPSSPDLGTAFPAPPQPQLVSTPTVAQPGRRPLADYSPGEIAGDAAKSFGVGVGRFATNSAGFLGDAREMLANGAQRAADYLAPDSAPNAGSKVSEFLSSYPLLAGPTSAQLQNAVESYTGPFYQPKTIVGDYAQTAGEFVPGALAMPGGGLARSALRYGLLPALSSETAGQLTKATAAEPWARALGAILGAAPGAWRDLPWAGSASEVAGTAAESQISTAEEFAARRRAQLKLNKAAGTAWESEKIENTLPKRKSQIQRQITFRSYGSSGLPVRVDAVGRDPMIGDILLSEMKASKTARLSRNQKIVYPELEKYGGYVVGEGKPPYIRGTKIPPTRVDIIRKP